MRISPVAKATALGGVETGNNSAQEALSPRIRHISSSRPGTQPANLQGIWNDSMTPPWDSKYTININTEMNYWPAEVCNLSECHEPAFELIESLVEPGRKTAKAFYDCPGWVAHVFTNLWGYTAPGWSERWGLHITGGNAK